MVNKYLNDNGLSFFWDKIKSTFVKQQLGKGLSSNDYTDSDKAKIDKAVSADDVLTKTNTTAFTPTTDYQPATKRYVDNKLGESGFVPLARKINGYTLESDVELHGDDIIYINAKTGATFKLGVDNGGLYYEEVTL